MMIIAKRMKFWRGLVVVVICCLVFIGGCEQAADETKPEVGVEKPALKAKAPEAVIALKFAAKDVSRYKVIMEATRNITWEGKVPDKEAFKGGETLNNAEITFTQEIQSVDENGNGVAKITIEELKYLAKVKDSTIIDFDSSRDKEPNNPLVTLIGRSYTIKIAPTGEVLEITDTEEARKGLAKGPSLADKTAYKLLFDDSIKLRHGMLILPAVDKNQLQPGENWRVTKNFSFGLMGSKTYEKIYTLKAIKDTGDRKIAVIEMATIPSSEAAEELHKKGAGEDFSKVFDNVGTYTGETTLDLASGKVEKCEEKLRSRWVMGDPAAKVAEDDPAILKMTANRLYHLEKID